MSRVSGEGVSNEGDGCGQAWSRVASETSEGEGSFMHAHSVTALGAELKEKAHVTSPMPVGEVMVVGDMVNLHSRTEMVGSEVDPRLGGKGDLVAEPEVDPCLGGKGDPVADPEVLELGRNNSSPVSHESTREGEEEQVEKVLNTCCDDVEVSLASRGEGGTSRDSTVHTVSAPRKEELRVEGVLAPLMEVGGGQVDPRSWARLLRQVPEVEVDSGATYDEFAASIFRLVGLRNRAVREYESADERSKESLARLEEQIAELRGQNDDLRREKVALEVSCGEERGLREGMERAVCLKGDELGAVKAELERAERALHAKGNELEAVKAELECAEGRVRSKEEEVRGLNLMLEKEGEAVGMVEKLREKVARLESDAARHEGEISAMDHGCRATLKRLLKEQADALYAGYEAKNGCMGLKLDHYNEARAEYDKAAKELHKWEGRLDAYKSLREKDGIPVPDEKLDQTGRVIEFQEKRLASLAVEEFHSGRLLLRLPEEIEAIEVDRLDFRSARYAL